MDELVFFSAAAIVLAGAIGVISSTNAVHSALMLVMTLFGIAVLFVDLDAHFLAAVQVIVYAGAIVVLFLFVIMLLGIDAAEDLEVEPLAGQRPAAGVVAAASLGLLFLLVLRSVQVTGAESVTGTLDARGSNIKSLGEALFTDYLFAFEATSALLVIAVVGAVVLARSRAIPMDAQAAAEAEGAAAAAGEISRAEATPSAGTIS